MTSGHGVDKPRRENEESRQVHRGRFIAADVAGGRGRQTTVPIRGERSILTGRLLNHPNAVPTGEVDMLTGQPIKAVPRRR